MTVHGRYSAGGTTGIDVARTGRRADTVQCIPHGKVLLFPRGGGFEIQSLEGRAAVPVKTTKKGIRFPTSATDAVRHDRGGHEETALGNPLQRMSYLRHRASSRLPNSSVVYREILCGFAESRIVLHESHGRLPPLSCQTELVGEAEVETRIATYLRPAFRRQTYYQGFSHLGSPAGERTGVNDNKLHLGSRQFYGC